MTYHLASSAPGTSTRTRRGTTPSRCGSARCTARRLDGTVVELGIEHAGYWFEERGL